ncbi:hypothetical protein LCGC14_1937880, partial [marine sediment metagenome]
LLRDGEPELMYGLLTHLCLSHEEVLAVLCIEETGAPA